MNMKIIISIVLLWFISCTSSDILTSNIEVTYYNGDIDTLNTSYRVEWINLNSNGCLYTGVGDGYKCCGVRTYRILNK